MKTKLAIQYLSHRMTTLVDAAKQPPLYDGWIKTMRSTLGMTLQQLADRLNVSRQSISDLESREPEGKVTLKRLQEVAHAMDMRLVYGLIPKDESLEALIERRARALATQIVQRTSTTMALEDQANSDQRIQEAIEERTASLIRQMPKALWN